MEFGRLTKLVNKTCNCGDYRIFDSDELNVGTAEFYPGDTYSVYGWNNYRIVGI